MTLSRRFANTMLRSLRDGQTGCYGAKVIPAKSALLSVKICRNPGEKKKRADRSPLVLK